MVSTWYRKYLVKKKKRGKGGGEEATKEEESRRRDEMLRNGKRFSEGGKLGLEEVSSATPWIEKIRFTVTKASEYRRLISKLLQAAGTNPQVRKP